MPFDVGSGKGSRSRQEAGSEQGRGEVGSPGQEAGPDSGEVAGMTPVPPSPLDTGPVGHFLLCLERNYKSWFFLPPSSEK